MRLGSVQTLKDRLTSRWGKKLALGVNFGELTCELAPADWLEIAIQIRDDPELAFNQLMDVCGVDYQEYGQSEWEISNKATRSGFSRGFTPITGARRRFEPPRTDTAEPRRDRPKVPDDSPGKGRRFWAVYHLLSHSHNWRLRVKVPPQEIDGVFQLDSVVEVWRSADWYEREAFDLFGIHFKNHPDLRRLLTDYGFIGHPMRKDFPLVGEVEVGFDLQRGRVIRQPVSIQPRVLVPKVVIPNTHRSRD